MAKKIPVILSLTFGYFLINAVVMAELIPATESDDAMKNIATRLAASSAALELILLGIVFCLFWKWLANGIAWALYFGGLAHTISLIFDQLILRIPSGAENIGLLGNRSIGASFTCVWIFLSLHLSAEDYIFRTERKYMLLAAGLLGGTAIAISQSGISYFAALVGIAAYFYAYNSKLWPFGLGIFGIGIAMGAHIKPQWWQHISRYDAWPLFFKHWRESAAPWFGWGAGGFSFYGPQTQIKYHFMVTETANHLTGTWWPTAHNDWLQILLEFGAVGLALSMASFFILLKMARPKPALFACLMAYASTMVANYPLHIAHGAILGAWLIFEAANQPPKGKQT